MTQKPVREKLVTQKFWMTAAAALLVALPLAHGQQGQTPATQVAAVPAPAQAAAPPSSQAPSPAPANNAKPEAGDTQPAAGAPAAAADAPDADAHDHMVQLPGGGPALHIRGFFDFNFGVGSIANPLVFPQADNGCGTCGSQITPPHSTFQAGEFDLFLTSKLSDHLNFLGEIVLGPDDTNEFAIDIERYTLTYKANKYFSAGIGRLPHLDRLLQHGLPSRKLVFDRGRTAHHVPVRG